MARKSHLCITLGYKKWEPMIFFANGKKMGESIICIKWWLDKVLFERIDR